MTTPSYKGGQHPTSSEQKGAPSKPAQPPVQEERQHQQYWKGPKSHPATPKRVPGQQSKQVPPGPRKPT